MKQGATIRIDRDPRGVATVTMDRAEVRNAFNPELIAELSEAAGDLAEDDRVRVVVLTGAGDVFSAGADLEWMRSLADASMSDNVADAGRMEAMLRALDELPKPLIGRVNGHALGGGAGLVATCDIVIAVEGARLGFTEARLGLAPAVISPYVVRKVGRSFARAMFITGERFTAERALAAGLVHEVVRAAALDAAVQAAVERCLQSGPRAVAIAKRLPELALAPLEEVAAATVEITARLRAGDEGQEGMAAFLERRAPAWAPEEP
ncbi:MAG TPA: enoyl-CoA hydratase-related protein [Egibacteraceae bacterium]|nr:enoyl-CoA hydratase-related protein [Egibacteraceae bacterium]